MTSLPWNQPWPSCWPPCVYGPFSFKSPKLRLASWTLQPGAGFPVNVQISRAEAWPPSPPGTLQPGEAAQHARRERSTAWHPGGRLDQMPSESW